MNIKVDGWFKDEWTKLYILLSDFDPIQFAWVDISVGELVKD